MRVHWWLPVLPLLVGCAGEAESAFEDRVPLPSCGTVDLDQGEELRRDAPDGVGCLREALASGEGGELRVTYPTVEGDPITAYYRVTPAGTTEVYEDGTEDPYGGEWSHATCARPRGVLDVAC